MKTVQKTLIAMAIAGVVTPAHAQLEEIVETKRTDLTAADMDAAVRTIAGSARAMGLNVED